MELVAPLPVDVLEVAVHRHCDVEWVSADDDVAGVEVEGDAVERCVGLEHSTMPLRCKTCVDNALGFDVPVDPWRHPGKGCREWSAVDEQEADHLHPGGAALRTGAHDDVVRAVLEVDPSLRALGLIPLHSTQATRHDDEYRPCEQVTTSVATFVGVGNQWHFDPDTYLAMVRSEIKDYDELQALIADATKSVNVTRVLDLGSGTGVTARRGRPSSARPAGRSRRQ